MRKLSSKSTKCWFGPLRKPRAAGTRKGWGGGVGTTVLLNDAPGEAWVDISCSGTTLDGRAVEVTGTATSFREVTRSEGNFVGTAAGQQVFSLECLVVSLASDATY